MKGDPTWRELGMRAWNLVANYRNPAVRIPGERGPIPKLDYRQQPSGEPFRKPVAPVKKASAPITFWQGATIVLYIILAVFAISLIVGIILLFGPLIGIGIILWMLGHSSSRR